MPLENHVGEFSLADDFDQAGRLEFFHMMRQGGGADAVGFVQHGAGHRFVAFADLLKNLVTSRLGQGAGDPGKLPVGYSNSSRRGHSSTIRPIRFAWQVRIRCRQAHAELKKAAYSP